MVAAGIFQAGGSLTARFAGFGELSVRAREKEERRTSGLTFKRYLLLVVTPSRLHVFDARSSLRWKVARSLVVWDRSSVEATNDPKSMTVRLSLDIPSEGRRVELEAPRARKKTAGVVAELLASGTVPKRVDLAPPERSATDDTDAAAPDGLRAQRIRVAAFVIAGGCVLGLAYFLPWVVVKGSSTVTLSGFQATFPWLGLGYAVVIVVAALFYVAGREEAGPRIFRSFGVGVLVLFAFQVASVLAKIGELRTVVLERGLDVDVAMGIGVWALLVAGALIFIAGLRAVAIGKRTEPQRSTYVPTAPR